ncbi:hypothetical protein ACFQV8_32135 [Pseudonocardia benzenivorans]
MGRFILRRVVQAVLVILAATLLIFLATFAIGDPFASSGRRPFRRTSPRPTARSSASTSRCRCST